MEGWSSPILSVLLSKHMKTWRLYFSFSVLWSISKSEHCQKNMKLLMPRCFIIALHFVSHSAKLFTECELVLELFEKHRVLQAEIYKHVCVTRNLNTGYDNSGNGRGIYSISEHWCGLREQNRSCKMTCNDLLDDDITDDVKCASLILSEQGVQAWRKNEEDCRKNYEKTVTDCLPKPSSTTTLRTTTSLRTTTAEARTTTVEARTTTVEARPTTIEAKTTIPEGSTQAITTELSKIINAPHQESQQADERYCAFKKISLLLIIIFVFVVIAIIIIVIKRSPETSFTSQPSNEMHLNKLQQCKGCRFCKWSFGTQHESFKRTDTKKINTKPSLFIVFFLHSMSK